jgi:pyruvate dehydrogenase E1 component alpha subunit
MYPTIALSPACLPRPPSHTLLLQARDPIPQFAKFMVANGLATESDIKALEAKVKEEVEDCVDYAENSPKPVSG